VRIAVRVEEPQRHGEHQANGHHEAKGHAHALVFRLRMRKIGCSDFAVHMDATGGLHLRLRLGGGMRCPRADNGGLRHRSGGAGGRRRGVTRTARTTVGGSVLHLGCIISLLAERRTRTVHTDGGSLTSWNQIIELDPQISRFTAEQLTLLDPLMLLAVGASGAAIQCRAPEALQNRNWKQN